MRCKVQRQPFLLLLVGISMLITYYRLSRVEQQHPEIVHRLTADELRELHTICGRASSYSSPKYRIAGGNRAAENQFPWAVRLFIKAADLPFFMSLSCTASLISRWHIVTAAHCIQYTDLGVRDVNVSTHFVAVAGTTCAHHELVGGKKCYDAATKQGTILRIKSVLIAENAIRHQVIQSMAWGKLRERVPIELADFALLELDKPIDVNNTDIRPICLHPPNQPSSSLYTLYGFGLTDIAYNKSTSGQLHYFETNSTVSENRCRTIPDITIRENCNRLIVMMRNATTKTSACKVIQSMAWGKLRERVPIELADFALLELDKPIDVNNTDIRPICLHPPNQPSSSLYTLYGFGLTDIAYNKSTSGQLHYFETNSTVSENRCRTIPDITIRENCKRLIVMMRNATTKTSACKGDSGGGVSMRKGRTHFLVGVISTGIGHCTLADPSLLATLGYMDVSVKLSSYHDFICFHTGICPMGYNRYMSSHPQRAFVLRSNTGKYSIGNGTVQVNSKLDVDCSKKHSQYSQKL
ncbi:Ovochymase-1 [Toxocara canis]|uniref:Ovochymase-1 n=1 Tax=Toxocara canis TaxID=6265 RepID=A0A0B2VV98_TOXCA|nr:Ovochymase-1 [Toxocara canis]